MNNLSNVNRMFLQTISVTLYVTAEGQLCGHKEDPEADQQCRRDHFGFGQLLTGPPFDRAASNPQ